MDLLPKLLHHIARWLPVMIGVLGAAVHAAGASGTVQDAGVQMRWHYESQAGQDGLGRLTIELSDQASGSPLRYQPGQLAAWLQRQRATLSDGELSCKDRVKSLVSTGIGRRADVDLNTYRILTLNSDRTLAFINPFIGLNNAKLESIVELPGTPRAWVHLPARAELWLLLDGAPARLAVIDTHRRRVARTLDLPAGQSTDATLAADERAGRLWLAQPASDRIASLELDARAPSWRSAPAQGLRAVQAVATTDGALILGTHADGRLTQWSQTRAGDAPRLVRQWSLPRPAQRVAYSALARRLVAYDEQALLSIDPEAAEVRRLALGHPVADVVLADQGRYALAVGGDRMSMVDLASGKLQAQSGTVAGARALALTERFAYAIGGDESSANLWALADLRAGRVQPAQVLLGSAGTPAAGDASLRRAVVAPGGNGLLVANAADRLIYQYSEGMMAPIGSFSNYKRTPLAIGLLDLGPREVAPGRYEVPVRYDAGGVHHLIVSGAGPRFVGCDRVALPMSSDQAQREAAPVLAARLVEDQPVGATRRRIVVAVSEQAPRGAAQPVLRLSDLTLLMFDKRSGWQQRTRLREQGDASGRYTAEMTVPQGVGYELFVGSVSRDLPFVQGRVADATASAAREEARP